MKLTIKKSVAGIIGPAFLATSLAACGSTPTTSATSKTPAKISIQLSWLPQYQFAGYYVAQAKGYYKAAHLAVTINPGGPGITAVQNVLSGADTVGLASPDQILKARSQGIPLKAIMVDFQHSPTGFMVHKSSGITSPRQFAGHVVGVNFGSNTQIEFDAMMAKLHVPLSSMHQVASTFSLSPFLQKKVAVWPVFVTDEPQLARAAGAHIRVFTPEQYGINFYQDVMFTKSTTVSSQGSVLSRFVAATQKGWHYAISHPHQADAILLKVNPKLTASHLWFETTHTIPLVADKTTKAHGFGYMTSARWKQIDTELAQLKIIPKPVAVKNAFTDQFIH